MSFKADAKKEMIKSVMIIGAPIIIGLLVSLITLSQA